MLSGNPRRPNLRSHLACDLIKRRIIRNEFPSMEKMNDSILAKQLHLGRTPVREALIMLETQGFLHRSGPSPGFYARAFSVKEISDLYDFRFLLERAILDRAISNITQEHREELSTILDEVNRSIKTGNAAEALARSMDFHVRFSEVSTDNGFIVDSLRSCYEKLILISWSCHNIEMCLKSAEEHAQILEAIRNKNRDALLKSVAKHNNKARFRALSLIQVDTKRLYIIR